MCMYVNPIKNFWRRVFWWWGSRTYYKVLEVDGRCLRSPHLSGGGYYWKGGFNKSNRERKKLDHHERGWRDGVGRGIHVFTSLDEAHLHQLNMENGVMGYGRVGKKNPHYTVVKVRCRRRDLVGFGSREAVFMGVTLTKKEYKKGTNG